eukprot:COSAG01_NODE_48198_length_383_cov_0.975352_2_plen_58_part_01
MHFTRIGPVDTAYPWRRTAGRGCHLQPRRRVGGWISKRRRSWITGDASGAATEGVRIL